MTLLILLFESKYQPDLIFLKESRSAGPKDPISLRASDLQVKNVKTVIKIG